MKRALLPALALASLFAAGTGAQSPEADEGPVNAAQTFVSAKDFVLYPPESGHASFKYLPSGSPLPFDRSLVLSAAPGEKRAYYLQTGDDSSVALGLAPVIAYVVDKTRPSAPRAKPGTGLYHESLTPDIVGDADSGILWAIAGPDGSADDFVPYSLTSRPRLEMPTKGSVTYTVLAYSVNASNTRSYPASFVYRLVEPGMPAAAPKSEVPALTADPSLPNPSIELQRGYAELRLALPPGASFLANFSTGNEPRGLDDFERIEAEGGYAKLRVPCPYAWSGDISLYFGILKDGAASYCPKPLVVHLEYPAEVMPAPAPPPMPVLAADPAGRGGFLTFPAYDDDIFVAIGSSEPALYSSPIPLSGDAESVRVLWYGENARGQRSTIRVQSFTLPRAVPDIEIIGAAEGAAIRGNVVLKPSAASLIAVMSQAKASIRYELSIDGTIPPEPGRASLDFGDSLSIDCPQGEEREVVLRYRLVTDEAASEGRILRFTLDRKPPEAPAFGSAPSGYSDRSLSLDLVPGLGGRDVYASVSADGSPADFFQLRSPLSLPGSEAGAVSYFIRAYDVDEAGNRSREMEAVSIVVDRTSVYVAEDGDDKGEGTPARPYRSLDAAIAAAVQGSKKSIFMRGTLEMRTPARFSTEISFIGGFGKSWVKENSARAQVRVALPRGQGAFMQSGGAISLRRIDIRADSSGPSPLMELSKASLSLLESSVTAGSDGDLVLISASQSKIDLSGSRIQALRAMSFTVISADRCDLSLTGSSIYAAKEVRIFGAVDMDGGSLSMRGSLVESRSDLGLNLLSLRSASMLVDRCFMNLEGGSGFLRLGSFKSVSGEMKNSKVLLAWNGPGTLFEIADGGPSFRHDTITAASAKSSLRFFEARGKPPQVWNCILNFSGIGGELLYSDSLPGEGVLVANCLWGFDKLLSGALETSDLQSLNALNARHAGFSSKPSISEAPEKTFGAAIKNQASLRESSACVRSAIVLGSGYEIDFSGRPRPAPGKDAPDIGADEFYD